MIEAKATEELLNPRVTAQGLAKICYEREGTTEAAASLMREMVLDDADLVDQFRDSAFLTWAHNAVQMHVSALRREQLGPVENDTQSSSETPSTKPFVRSYKGHRLVVEATLYDMPMFGGRRLGDCLKTELLEGAAESDLRVASMQRTNAFARAVANSMRNASLTVEQQLSLSKLEEIQASST